MLHVGCLQLATSLINYLFSLYLLLHTNFQLFIFQANSLLESIQKHRGTKQPYQIFHQLKDPENLKDTVMEKEGEREKVEANNFAVSFSALREDVVNVLDFMERLKNEEDQTAVVVSIIERLKFELPFICMSIQLPYSDLEHFEEIMTVKRLVVEDLLRSILCDAEPNVGIKYDIHHVLPSLMDNINDCISSCHHSTSSATMTDEQLNFLFLNLHHLSKFCAQQIFPLLTQYEIIQKEKNVYKFSKLLKSL